MAKKLPNGFEKVLEKVKSNKNNTANYKQLYNTASDVIKKYDKLSDEDKATLESIAKQMVKAIEKLRKLQ
jgi:hypothetical protein